jgi:hypothetical protein
MFETSSALTDGADSKPDAMKAMMRTETKTMVGGSWGTFQG